MAGKEGNAVTTQSGSNPVKMVNGKLSSLLDLCYDMITDLNQLDDTELSVSGDADLKTLQEKIPKFKSAMEGIYMKLDNLKFD